MDVETIQDWLEGDDWGADIPHDKVEEALRFLVSKLETVQDDYAQLLKRWKEACERERGYVSRLETGETLLTDALRIVAQFIDDLDPEIALPKQLDAWDDDVSTWLAGSVVEGRAENTDSNLCKDSGESAVETQCPAIGITNGGGRAVCLDRLGHKGKHDWQEIDSEGQFPKGEN